MISVVIPTVPGRDAHLARCIVAYQERTMSDLEIIVEHGHDCCGKAWNAGIVRATGIYLHLTADDLEPCMHWDLAALKTTSVAAMYLPAPVIYKADGQIESIGGNWPASDISAELDGLITTNTCVVPFLPRFLWEEIGPMIETHYYTDNFYSHRARGRGWRFVINRRYAFRHHWATERRGAGMTEQERMAHDKAIYETASIT